jgi:predicted transcriptional regulator
VIAQLVDFSYILGMETKKQSQNELLAHDALALKQAMSEWLKEQVNAWAMIRALREHALAGQSIPPERDLSDRETVTLFIAKEFPKQISAKTLTKVFGIQFSSAMHILRALAKKGCIKGVQRGGSVEILPTGDKLLSDFKSREATCWHDLYKEIPPEKDPLAAYQIRSERLNGLYRVAKRLFENRVLAAPKVQLAA